MEEAQFQSLVTHRDAVSDTDRWRSFEPRDDDIFVCTPAKCGTTWTQTICCNLLRPDGVFEEPVGTLSPWIEAIFRPEEEVNAAISAQPGRRVLKSHSHADSIPWFENARYIFVARDGRDAFMSMVNHNERMKFLDDLNRQAAMRGVPAMRKYEGDPHRFFDGWMDAGVYFELVAGYWAKKEQENLLLVHYADLKADLEGEIRRIAGFLDITLNDDEFTAVASRCTFEYMREHPEMVGEFDGFEGGIKGFIFKGQNGRWKDVLTPDELERYETKLTRTLPQSAAEWTKLGRRALEETPAG